MTNLETFHEADDYSGNEGNMRMKEDVKVRRRWKGKMVEKMVEKMFGDRIGIKGVEESEGSDGEDSNDDDDEFEGKGKQKGKGNFEAAGEEVSVYEDLEGYVNAIDGYEDRNEDDECDIADSYESSISSEEGEIHSPIFRSSSARDGIQTLPTIQEVSSSSSSDSDSESSDSGGVSLRLAIDIAEDANNTESNAKPSMRWKNMGRHWNESNSFSEEDEVEPPASLVRSNSVKYEVKTLDSIQETPLSILGPTAKAKGLKIVTSQSSSSTALASASPSLDNCTSKPPKNTTKVAKIQSIIKRRFWKERSSSSLGDDMIKLVPSLARLNLAKEVKTSDTVLKKSSS